MNYPLTRVVNLSPVPRQRGTDQFLIVAGEHRAFAKDGGDHANLLVENGVASTRGRRLVSYRLEQSIERDYE